MLKKIFILSTILAATNVATANPAPYIGADLGISTLTATYPVSEDTEDTKDRPLNHNRSLPLGLFAGYGGNIGQNFYLGGEMGVSLLTSSFTKNSYKNNRNYTISVIPGLMINDHTMAFARLGLVYSKFNIPKEELDPNKDINFNKTGKEIGVGLQTSLTPNIDLRGEYDFIRYPASSHSARIEENIGLRADQFNLGIIYKFD